VYLLYLVRVLGKLLDACIWLDDESLLLLAELAEHAQLIIFCPVAWKKWVHENVSFRSVYNGQLQLCICIYSVVKTASNKIKNVHKEAKIFDFWFFEIRRPLRSQISLEIGKKLCNEIHIHINDEERWTLGCLCIFHFLSCRSCILIATFFKNQNSFAIELSSLPCELVWIYLR
jgi:hypothetical protein